jgi:hypothetical protein
MSRITLPTKTGVAGEVNGSLTNAVVENQAKKETGDTGQLAEAPPPGLVNVPETPTIAAKVAVAISAEKGEPVFKSFMKIDSFKVRVKRPNVEGVEEVQVSALRGPGDNCTVVVPIVLAPDGEPRLLLKAGNTRAAHEMRRWGSYVLPGLVAGRWDVKIGADAEAIGKKIGIAETAEEVGAKVIEGGAFVLGDQLVPTTPNNTTEADLPVLVIAQAPDASKITGDMTGMELVGLMKPMLLTVSDAFAAARSGAISEGGRFEAYARRALDKIGWIPELGAYVHDLPKTLQEAFLRNATPGLGPLIDPRKLVNNGAVESDAGVGHGGAPPKPVNNAAQVDAVTFVEYKSVPLPEGDGVMFDAKTDHAISNNGARQAIGKVHPNQILHLDYDLAKVGTYYDDPMRGPMVKLELVERPIPAAKGLALADEVKYPENHNLTRLDVPEVKVPLPFEPGMSPEEIIAKAKTLDIPHLAEEAIRAKVGPDADLMRLDAQTFASPGGTDLQYHFYAVKLKAPPTDTTGFVPVSEAVRIMRGGEGDVETENFLQRLASANAWVPSLGMKRARAEKIAS